jgi:hypothetical protein
VVQTIRPEPLTERILKALAIHLGEPVVRVTKLPAA